METHNTRGGLEVLTAGVTSGKAQEQTPRLSLADAGRVTEGDAFTLRCEVRGEGWKFLWFKASEGGEMLDGGTGGNYTVRSAALVNSGQYWCFAGRNDGLYYVSNGLSVQVTVLQPWFLITAVLCSVLLVVSVILVLVYQPDQRYTGGTITTWKKCVLTAYLDGVLREAPLPEPVASELRLLADTLLQTWRAWLWGVDSCCCHRPGSLTQIKLRCWMRPYPRGIRLGQLWKRFCRNLLETGRLPVRWLRCSLLALRCGIGRAVGGLPGHKLSPERFQFPQPQGVTKASPSG
ncbi:UNVERIFIED_CONTAM: hypothetical protein FKN15_057008 [Acipenser sinensis]